MNEQTANETLDIIPIAVLLLLFCFVFFCILAFHLFQTQASNINLVSNTIPERFCSSMYVSI